ncbi:MAG: aspartate aminotransferase family protein [Deltaproteobacteria bacterium]|nr:aspartate aminotransferase family protein [Deltaproteobacteria bacterium]
MKIPTKGLPKEEVFSQLEAFRAGDVDWRSGRTWAYVYDPGRDAEAVIKQAYAMYLSENALDPTAFPSMLKLETTLVGLAAAHLNGTPGVVGNFTSGGTESIILAVKTARDYARAHRPGLGRCEVVLPVTAHAAFHKACHYLDMQAVTVPVDPTTFKADVDAMRAAITPNTVLLVGSAVSYAHGVIDPIEALGALALERDLLLHVDACMGGFLLPYFRRLGVEVPPFDFSVPGVTSISMDLHKYAFAAKGASVILHRNKDLRRHQIYTCATWTGYSVVNPTVQSTKSGGPLAAAWAVLNFLGDEGYLALARQALEATQALVTAIDAMDDLRLLGRPQMNLIAFTSDTVNVFHIIDEMKLRGWYIQPQFGFHGSKENIHLSVNPASARWVEPFLEDLRACTAIAKTLPSGEIARTVREAFAGVDPAAVTPEMLQQMLGMVGASGNALPTRMAEINEILNALPAELTEVLLTEFLNELHTPPA